MSNYSATILWKRNGQSFIDNQYSRLHQWQLQEGTIIEASSSPQIVPTPFSDPTAIDPEEAFIASLASCHMLWFLSIASKKGFSVEHYKDNAKGFMEKDINNSLAITKVVLRPHTKYLGDFMPSKEEDHEMHHEAHSKCFIANSVKTDIEIESRMSKIKPEK